MQGKKVYEYLPMDCRVLRPGEFVYSINDCIYTIVGDCCVLCLYEPMSRTAGLCSFVLPESENQERERDAMRQTVAFIELLMADFVKAGISRTQLTAKVFGLGGITLSSKVMNKNLLFIKHYLGKEKIRLLSSSTDSGAFRELFFLPESGNAFLRQCNDVNEITKWQSAEREYIDKAHSAYSTRYVLFNEELSVS